MSKAVSVAGSKSLWSDAYLRLKKNKGSMISAYFILFICFVALFAKYLAPFSFETQDIEKILQSPNTTNLLGTDSLGRDLFSRIIYGSRMSIAVGILTSLVSLVIGATFGAISGWVGGKVDAVMMRFVDILYSIPTLVLMIIVKVIFESVDLFDDPELKALTSMLMALSIVGWVTLARVVRGQVLQLREMAYVEAAEAMGAKASWVLLKHIFPNMLGPIIVLLTFQIPSNILFESFLSFIGLGLQPPFSSLGVLAQDGWKSLEHYPHLIISPSVVLFLIMLAFNLFGDGLRDAFDPKLKGR